MELAQPERVQQIRDEHAKTHGALEAESSQVNPLTVQVESRSI